VGPGLHEVVTPHLVPIGGPQPDARAIVEPQPSSRLLLLWYFQPFATPDAFDSILADLPAGSIEQRREPAIPRAAILAGKYNDGLSQSIFVFTLRRRVALRASGLKPRTIARRLGSSP